MQTYISLLRGINVSGQKKIIMSDLKELYAKQGFSNVQTYIQSGNVVFNYEKTQDYFEIAAIIEQAIEKKYDFQVPVLIRQAIDLKRTLENNPYAEMNGVDLKRVGVTFLEKHPTNENLLKLGEINFPPDEFIVDGLNIYLHCPEGFGKSKISNKLFENKLKVRATSRNLRTINKLIEMSS